MTNRELELTEQRNKLQDELSRLREREKQLEAERSELKLALNIATNPGRPNHDDELRNKVIDEAIDKLFRGVSLNEHQRGDIEQLLNSLKTK